MKNRGIAAIERIVLVAVLANLVVWISPPFPAVAAGGATMTPLKMCNPQNWVSLQPPGHVRTTYIHPHAAVPMPPLSLVMASGPPAPPPTQPCPAFQGAIGQMYFPASPAYPGAWATCGLTAILPPDNKPQNGIAQTRAPAAKPGQPAPLLSLIWGYVFCTIHPNSGPPISFGACFNAKINVNSTGQFAIGCVSDSVFLVAVQNGEVTVTAPNKETYHLTGQEEVYCTGIGASPPTNCAEKASSITPLGFEIFAIQDKETGYEPPTTTTTITTVATVPTTSATTTTRPPLPDVVVSRERYAAPLVRAD